MFIFRHDVKINTNKKKFWTAAYVGKYILSYQRKE